jgi:FtsZ-binding cell division protein ZapB
MAGENDTGDTGDIGFDLGSSMDAIASGMEGKTSEVDAAQATAIEAALEAPKSWPKEMHEHWSKTPRNVQEYWNTREKQMLDGLDQYKGDATYARSLREVLTPYSEHLKSQGISETEAIGYLLNAHFGLTNGSPEERRALYQKLGADLGLVEQQQGQQDSVATIQQLQREIAELKSYRQSDERARTQQLREKVDAELKSFASDPANVHFNDVAKDMVRLVQAGYGLKEAYETAVWANPAARQKEQARLQTAAEAERKEKARVEAENAKRAAGVNVRSAKSQSAPTEPKGSMEETMRDTLKSIRARA